MPAPDDELDAQLRAYIDGATPPVGTDVAMARGRRRVARKRAAGIGAIAAVALLIGGGAIAIAANGGGRSGAPADTTIAPATATATSTTAETTTTAAPRSTTTMRISPPVTASPVTSAPATMTWNQIIAGPDGVFGYNRANRQLVRFDDQGRIIASRRQFEFDDLRVDTDGLLFGTAQQGGGTDVLQQIDARTLDVVTTGRVPTGLLTGSGNRLWIATAHILQRRLLGTGPGGPNEPSITVPGAPMADLAIDPSGQRLYVLQYDPSKQQSLLSVRSAIDGRLITAPKVVGTGPAAGHIAATTNGVWLVQPTGTQGTAQRFDGTTLTPTDGPFATSNRPLLVAVNSVAVFGPTAPGGLQCTLESGPVRRASIAVEGAPKAIATDGQHVYVALADTGIEVIPLPRGCAAVTQ